MNVRIENWMGHEIRFVEIDTDDWWAVAKDVSEALGYRDAFNMTRKLDKDELCTRKVSMGNITRKMLIVSEMGIYESVFNSERPEAKEFKKWVKRTIKELRKLAGLEGFQVFRMLDKEHQKEAMSRLNGSLRNPVRVDFIKANTIANKAVSSFYGHPKMLKKDQMTPDMLVRRQEILNDAVNLMSMSDKFKLDISISETIYDKYMSDVQRNREAN
ncbi:BRO-N domain-containing protein [Paenibacillus urinalis]|uniref:BRO-N domain-containing protein n=1 Tax=Paenibacillus urinalis TaxID=521520 RepID=UPI0019619ECC